MESHGVPNMSKSTNTRKTNIYFLFVVLCAASISGLLYFYWRLKHPPASPSLPEAAQVKSSVPVRFVPGDILIRWKAGTPHATKEAIRSKYQTRLKNEQTFATPAAAEESESALELDTLQTIGTAEAPNDERSKMLLLDTINKLSKEIAVQAAQPNYIYVPADSPNATTGFHANDLYYKNGVEWGVTSSSTTNQIGANQQSPHRHRPTRKPQNRRTTASGRSRTVERPRKPRVNASKIDRIVAQSTGLESTEIHSVQSEYGVKADSAWARGNYGEGVYVGVVDTGVDFKHPDLKTNIWSDIGMNYYSPDGGPLREWDAAEDAHGTHVAGIIAAVGNNGKGIIGVAWRSKMIIAKFMGGIRDEGRTVDAIKAIDFLTDLKRNKSVKIVAINLSWVGGGHDTELLGAIKRAAREEILCITAAGNASDDNDKDVVYPANFDTSKDASDGTPALLFNSVVSVASIKPDGHLADTSNYGRTNVHIAAPGVDIISTCPTDRYCEKSGTSMAAPFVSGAVALYASTHPKAKAQEIRAAILKNATQISSLKGL